MKSVVATRDPIKNGIYKGIWGGYVLRFTADGVEHVCTTAIGIRTPRAECKVTVDDGRIYVECVGYKGQGSVSSMNCQPQTKEPRMPQSTEMLDRWASRRSDRIAIEEFWSHLLQAYVPTSELLSIDIEKALDKFHSIDQKQLEHERQQLLETYSG